MVDERAAYPDSSRRSEQLSCTRYFHLSYGLFSINFQSYNYFLNLLLIQITTVSCYVYSLWTSQSGLQVGAVGLVDTVDN